MYTQMISIPRHKLSSMGSCPLAYINKSIFLSFKSERKCAMDEIEDKGELLVIANLAEQAERYDGESK